MHTLTDLDGVTLARATASADECSLVILAPSGFGAGANYYPAESITLSSLSAIAALRDICEQLIEAHLELSQDGAEVPE